MKRFHVGRGRAILLAAMNVDRAGVAQLDRDDPRRRVGAEKHRVLFKFHGLPNFLSFRAKSRNLLLLLAVIRSETSRDVSTPLDMTIKSADKSRMNICSLSIVILSISVSNFAFAQETSVEKAAVSELPSLLAIYKDIHAHPELSTREEKTSALVAMELRAVVCEVTENFGNYDNPNLQCYGVVGIMKNGTGPTVLVRTDMDALPVEEDTGLPYASKITAKGDDGREVHVMHACGHDAHMSAFIGTARALQRLKDRWSGTIVFVGQPAEETVGGARALLKAGLYNRFGKPDFALGFHDKADLQTGHLAVTPGYTYANVDSVDVTVRGIGGHRAYPHKTKNPIVLPTAILNTSQPN